MYVIWPYAHNTVVRTCIQLAIMPNKKHGKPLFLDVMLMIKEYGNGISISSTTYF